MIGGTAILLCAVLAFFFVRRAIVEYEFGHTFGVRDAAFFGSAHALGNPVPIQGNKIEILNNGDEIFPAMLEAIRGARQSVNFEAYLVHSGKVSAEFFEAFSERAKAGVKVRILLDGVGSGTPLKNSDVEGLKNAGCHFAYYYPAHSLRMDRANRRTHRRIMVVDGKLGFTGGVGFADVWLGDAQSKDHWRDVHAKIQGPLVASLQAAFQQHWAVETGEVLTGPEEFPSLKHEGPLQAQLIASSQYSLAPFTLLQAVAIAAAETNVYITNPYCTPSKAQTKALVDAVKRGVDVRLLLPGKFHDAPLTKAAGRSSYGDLLEGGVKLFEYRGTMIHSKTMVIDGMFSVLGTSNLDVRSSQINEEIDVTVYDEEFGSRMEAMFLKDLTNAQAYELNDFKQRGLWEKFSEWVTIPLRSQL